MRSMARTMIRRSNTMYIVCSVYTIGERGATMATTDHFNTTRIITIIISIVGGCSNNTKEKKR